MTNEQLRRLQNVASTASFRSDASVRLSDLAALLKMHDAQTIALSAILKEAKKNKPNPDMIYALAADACALITA